MMGSIGGWIVAAVLLFWSVGAYNRLVRLRAEAIAAFAALDAQWQRQLGHVDNVLPASLRPTQLTQPGELLDEVAQLWLALRDAAGQLSAALAGMRPRPLQPDTAAAVASAQAGLVTAWRLVQQEANDLAGASMPETVDAQWHLLMTDTGKAQLQFNEAVMRYNAAIAQFPAVLLARLFRFGPAATV